MQRERMLQGCRALDLTDETGFLCGKMLADLGVDVIKVERPGGDASRRVGPFCHDVPDRDGSLYWFAYNADKRGITLDIESRDGRRIFLDLVKVSHFVIESFPPGHMTRLGLDYPALADANPRLVLASITPFGQTGPFSGYAATDLVAMGMAGQLLLTGDADRSPVNIGLAQACMHAGADAAVGCMVAHRHAVRTGNGQHVDVSMQQSAAWFLATTIPWWELNATVMSRVGTFRGGGSGAAQRQVWPSRDGYVFFFMIGGQQGAKTCRQLVRWMDDVGMPDPFLATFEWEKFDMASATQDVVDRISAPIERFFRTRTRQEILEAAISRGISICPLFGMKDLLNDPHLAQRGFWSRHEHPALDATIPYPSRFVRSSENETGTALRAPRVGEHNVEVFSEIGLTRRQLIALEQAGVI
ncbi:MAG: CoA transferase [Burkholderiaceae bacterium]|nr:CoA transferase [Burkholderiaceae bacterium]